MYDYLDRAVVALPEPDRFLLAAMRGWVTAVRGGRCPCCAIAGGFAARAVTAALPDFTMAMAALDQDGLVRLAFAPRSCTVVSDDEARLLALFAAGRHAPRETLQRMAATLVVEAAVSRLASAVGFIGDAITEDEA